MSKGIHIDEDTLAVFSLEALEPREARRVRQHLDGCDRCRALLRSYQLVADGLLHTAMPAQPPARLRARILAAISDDQVERESTGWQKLRRWPLQQLAIVLSIALLVLNVGLWVQLQAVRQTEKQLVAQGVEDRIAQGLYAYPDVQRTLIEGEGVYGSAIYEQYLQFAVLYVWGLESLPEGQIYQAWLIEPGGDRISGGLFDVAESESFIQVVIRAPDTMKAYDGIGVTIEPAGGSAGPTGQKVLGVDL